MRIEKRLIMVAKFLPLTAIVVAIALVLAITLRFAPGERASAVVDPGVNFNLGSSGCNSDGVATCSVLAGGTATISFSVTSANAAGYKAYDLLVDFSGNINYNVGSLVQQGAGVFPTCDLPTGELFPTGSPKPAATPAQESAGSMSTSCSQGIAHPSSTSYTGTLATFTITCKSPGTGTLALEQGDTNTDLVDASFASHSEAAAPALETLTINCLANTNTPTQTPTVTLTPTKTPTLTPTVPPPTVTRTPTVSPTVTNTPTATPLPSDQPDVTVTKTDSPDPVDANGTLTYSLLVKNLGLQPATGVIVGDQLPVGPNGVVFISATSSGALCYYTLETNLVLCKLSDPLPAGGQVKIIIVVTAPTPSKEKGDVRISNFANVVASNEPFFNQGNNKDKEETVVLAPRADLTLTKTDRQDPVDSGGTIVYDLTAKNIGPQKATNVLIKENLPDGSTFLPGSSSPECTVPGGAPVPDTDIGSVDVQCDLGASFVGETTVHIAITAPQEHRDTLIKNVAFVTGGNELFSQTGNNLAVQNTAVLAPPPDVALDKAGPAKVRRTQKLSYTLTVTNIGFGDAFNVGVSDTLPKYILDVFSQPMTLQSVTGASCGAPVGQQFSCTIPKLPGSGGQVVITVNVRAPTAVTDVLLTNQASATDPGEPGDPAGNNSDSQDTTIQACFDVTGDGLVRAADILSVTAHYGARTGNPNYDLLFDFNGDGAITAVDILYVTQHYGQNCA
jgi:uncharacterized repeat protein (TIGR01451 family)